MALTWMNTVQIESTLLGASYQLNADYLLNVLSKKRCDGTELQEYSCCHSECHEMYSLRFLH